MTRVLVVDNYDSFVFNLVQYLGQLGAECVVRRNDEPEALDVRGVDGVLLSPGPGTPEQAGASVEIVRRCEDEGVPLLGVCLGHQAIAVAHGATVSRAPELLHGKTSEVEHAGAGVLEGLPTPFTATRYHSLAVEEATLPQEPSQVASSWWPPSVSTDSGWNCTPSMGSSRCRSAMTIPDGVCPVTSSSAGTVAGSTAREW